MGKIERVRDRTIDVYGDCLDHALLKEGEVVGVMWPTNMCTFHKISIIRRSALDLSYSEAWINLEEHGALIPVRLATIEGDIEFNRFTAMGGGGP